MREKKETVIRIWVWNSWTYFKVPDGPCESAEFELPPSIPSHSICGPVNSVRHGNCAYTSG